MKFKDFVTLQRGFDLPRTQMEEGPHPVVGSTSIIGYHAEFKVSPPGVVTGRSGSLGKVQYLTVPYWPHNTALWVKDFKGNYPRFVYYCIQTLDFAQFNAGAGVPTLNRNHLDSLDVSVPALATQRKIAGVLSAYDDLIENNTRRIAILEEMAQAIYREWFVNFRFPGHEKVKLINSPLGKIPEGWKWAKLKDVCDSVNYGYTASANKEVEVGPRFLRITDIVPTSIDWENVPYCEVDEDDAAKYALGEGNIVIARTGATTGYAKRLHKRHPKSVFASYLVRIVPSEAMGKHYIGLIVESDDYKAFIKRNLGGAAQPQANAQVLTSLDVLVPSPDAIATFDRQIEPMADQKEILQEKNRNLRKTRDLLLPKLIGGQLDVEELDIDAGEPLEAEAE
ncbi:MAG: restriction endonuclease subunit S [Zavarzinella sp.]